MPRRCTIQKCLARMYPSPYRFRKGTKRHASNEESTIMQSSKVQPAVGRELQSMTDATGIALVHFGERTFVTVEVERDTVQTPPSIYQVADPDEVADLRDALNDQNNPSYSSAEALAYLRDLRQKRGDHGHS